MIRWFQNFVSTAVGADGSQRYPKGSDTNNASQQVVVDILINEVQLIYAAAEQKSEDVRKSQVCLQMGGADYSWLFSPPKQTAKIPAADQNHLESLCLLIRPIECNRVMNHFRLKDCSDILPGHPKCRNGSHHSALNHAIVGEIREGD